MTLVVRGDHVDAFTISGAPRLDPIQVVLHNGPARGQGRVTISTWGRAWTAYFGGMPHATIDEFLRTGFTDYFVEKLLLMDGVKVAALKDQRALLTRIVEAVKAALVLRKEREDEASAPLPMHYALGLTGNSSKGQR